MKVNPYLIGGIFAILFLSGLTVLYQNATYEEPTTNEISTNNLIRFSNETVPILMQFYGNYSEGKNYVNFLVNMEMYNQVPCPQRFENVFTLAYCFEIKEDVKQGDSAP